MLIIPLFIMKDGQGMLAHLAEFIWIAQLSSATRRPQKQINNSNQSSRGKDGPFIME